MSRSQPAIASGRAARWSRRRGSTGRVVQVGAQCRSAPYVAAAIEYLQSGKLGEIHFVKVFNSKPRSRIGNPPDQPVPAGVDYDMWLGPAPLRPFNENHFHAWNWFWVYSGGDLINDGVHQLDLARWCISRSHPRSVFHRRPSLLQGCTGHARYANRHLGLRRPDHDVRAIALESVSAEDADEPARYRRPAELALQRHPRGDIRQQAVDDARRHGDGWEVFDGDFKSVAHQFGRQANDEHVANFVDCIRSRKTPNADIEELHYSTLLCHYGNISYRLGRKLVIDPGTEAFVRDDEANRLVERTYRQPWVVPEFV